MSAARIKEAFDRFRRKLSGRFGSATERETEFKGSKRRAARLRDQFCAASGVELDERPRFLGRRHGHPNAA